MMISNNKISLHYSAEAIQDQFQKNIFDLKQDDETLQRFLKYSGYNPSKAEEMLRRTVKWRKDNDVASYLHWKPPPAIAQDFKFKCIGEDKDGHSVIYLPIGGWQTKKMMELGDKDSVFNFRFHLLESIMESVIKTKKSKFVMIMDMEGLTYKKCLHYETIQFLSLAFKDFEENYPERLRSCYVINTPWAFTYIYNILKHILSSKTLDKAKIFNENEDIWKTFLMDKIPMKNLDRIFNMRKIASQKENK